MTPTLYRRALLLALVLLAASQLGCATADVICDVRQDYVQTTSVPARGEVRITWERGAKLPDGRYGWTVCDRERKNCHIQLSSPPDYNRVCEVHDFGHELLESLGQGHN